MCCVGLSGGNPDCFLFLFYLHHRGPRWLDEKSTIIQFKWLALCVKTQAEKQSCPFTLMNLYIFGSLQTLRGAVEFSCPKAFGLFSYRPQARFSVTSASTKCCWCVRCLPACLPPPGFARVLGDSQTSLSAHHEHINYVLCFHGLFRRI